MTKRKSKSTYHGTHARLSLITHQELLDLKSENQSMDDIIGEAASLLKKEREKKGRKDFIDILDALEI